MKKKFISRDDAGILLSLAVGGLFAFAVLSYLN